MSTKAPNPVDKYVGSRVRMRRIMLGMSQEKLGEALGLTFQQIQKYENGANRVGSGRLAKISKVLDVPIDRFFHNRTTGSDGEGAKDVVTELLASPYALRMLNALKKIPDNKVRLSLVALTESIADKR